MTFILLCPFANYLSVRYGRAGVKKHGAADSKRVATYLYNILLPWICTDYTANFKLPYQAFEGDSALLLLRHPTFCSHDGEVSLSYWIHVLRSIADCRVFCLRNILLLYQSGISLDRRLSAHISLSSAYFICVFFCTCDFLCKALCSIALCSLLVRSHLRV